MSAVPTTMDKPQRIQLRSLRAAVAGNVLEWFDWTLYAVFTSYIASHFFDSRDHASALLPTLAVFAVGFLARPLGAFVFGKVADARGRKFVLIVTISMMSLSSLLIAVAPSYQQIGGGATAILLIARLGQGFAHGGESGVSYTYVAEIAPAARRGMWSSSVFMAATVGAMLATLVGALLIRVLGQEAVADYGWRFAFAIAAVLGLFVLILRRTAVETPQFIETSETLESAAEEAFWTRSRRFKAGLLVTLLSAGHNAAYYIWAIFTPTFAITGRGMKPSDAFIASLLAQAVALVALFAWGRLSDKVGRRPMIFAFGILGIASFYPLSLLISDQPWTLFAAQALGMTIWALGASSYPTLTAELFPTRIRASSVAIATAVTVAMFGGTAPYLLTWWTRSGVAWLFWVWIAVLGVLAIVGGLIVRETKGEELGSIQWPFRVRDN